MLESNPDVFPNSPVTSSIINSTKSLPFLGLDLETVTTGEFTATKNIERKYR